MKILKLFRDFVIIVLIPVRILAGSEWILRIVFPEKILNENVAYEFNEDFHVHLKPNLGLKPKLS